MKNIILLILMISSTSLANQIDWKGGYRFEYLEIDRPSLSTPFERKSYGMHYLYLSPRLIVSDGMQVVTRFDIMGDQGSDYSSYLGSIWGQGNSGTNTNPGRSNTLGRSASGSALRVSQMYFNLNQENASLILGRAPFEFGMGMNYSVGDGMFDHWNNNRDQISFKVLVDNLVLMPFISRLYDDGYQQGNLVQDEGIMVLYDNDQTGNLIGVMVERKKASVGSNDVPVDRTANPGAIGDSRFGDMNVQRTNFMLSKEWDTFDFKFEAGFLSGDLGVVNAGQNVRANGYGVATEWNLKTSSNWNYQLKAGIASGDNPDTADYEGFHFDRNYDVAFLLFNHRLGVYDVLRTGAIKSNLLGVGTSPDDEAISNAYYFSPVLKYRWNEKMDLNQTFTMAQLVTSPIANNGASKDLGFEYDIELVYKPRDKVRWINQLGLLFPGAAFKPESIPGAEKNFTFGFATKLGVQF